MQGAIRNLTEHDNARHPSSEIPSADKADTGRLESKKFFFALITINGACMHVCSLSKEIEPNNPVCPCTICCRDGSDENMVMDHLPRGEKELLAG